MELISLELATCEMNSDEWNEVMMWIFDEADKCGMKVDVTLGEFWPIATEMIPVEDRYTDVYKRQVYVSCDPATMARDLKWFDALGYRTETVQPVDMFPRTKCVEFVTALERTERQQPEG